MDREISQDYLKKERVKKILIYSFAAAAIIILVIIINNLLTPSLDKKRIRTCKAEYGPVESVLNGSGKIIPGKEQIIISPINSRILSVNYLSGEKIPEGKSLITLEREQILNQAEKVKNETEIMENELTRLRLKMERELGELNSELEIKQLQIKYLESVFEREKKLFDIGASAKTSLDQSELNKTIAARELELLERQIGNRKKVLEAELREKELLLLIKKREAGELANAVDLSLVKAEFGGVITWIKNETGANVNKGEIIARIADLNNFRVEGKISDMHAGKLEKGLPVRIRINRNDIYGKIESISPEINESLVSFNVQLNKPSEKILRPNQQAELFVIIDKKEKALRVKNGPFFTGLSDQKIYVMEENSAIRKNIGFGISNFDWIELTGDIKEGDVVIISNMEKFYHMEKIEIN